MTTTPTLKVAATMERSRVNGPGERVVVWLQGCPRRCTGCFNQSFLSEDGGTIMTSTEVIEFVQSVKGVDGVTFSGGEPLAQARGLLPVVSALSDQGMGIVMFTGFKEAALMTDVHRRRVVERCDLIVAGPYRRELPGTNPLLASTNQTLVFMTDRYKQWELGPRMRSHEFTISADGTASLTGFPIT